MIRKVPVDFAIGYGALEAALAGLVGADGEAVRIRFRKLRLRPFPDIQTGIGQRVRYDLPRAIAIAAVFELNALLLPQGQAVALVQRAWPEVCRAAIAAAVELDLARHPAGMPDSAGPNLALMPDAFARGASADVVAAVAGSVWPSASHAPAIQIDMRRIVGALSAAASGSEDALAMSAAELEQSFGWSRPILKSGEVSRVVRGVSFLAEGPWFERAEALLTAPDGSFEPSRRPDAAIRMQALLDYLLAPAPVDAWKGEIGECKSEPRLKHLLAAFGRDRGLQVFIPHVLTSSAGPEPADRALDLLGRAAKRAGAGRPGSRNRPAA